MQPFYQPCGENRGIITGQRSGNPYRPHPCEPRLRKPGSELTDRTEVEEERQFSPAGQAGVGLTQLVEEGVRTRLQGRQPRHRGVLQQPRAEGDGLRRGARLEYLAGGKSIRPGWDEGFGGLHARDVDQ